MLSWFKGNDEQRQANALFTIGALLYLAFLAFFNYLPSGWSNYGLETFNKFLIWSGGSRLASGAVMPDGFKFLVLYQLSSAKFLFVEIIFFAFVFLLYGKNVFMLREYKYVVGKHVRMKNVNMLDLFLGIYVAFLFIYFFDIQGMCPALVDECASRKRTSEVPLFYFISFLLISCAPYFVSLVFRKLKIGISLSDEV
tara:strand:- start:5607 stop:6197 length:591 start_codon:yes stop_codon:yes gene_type:complete